MKISSLTILTLGLIGGLAGGWLARSMEKPAFADFGGIVSGQEFQLLSSSGKMIGQLTSSAEGKPALFLYDSKGNARLELGLYEDDLPFIGLFSEGFEAKTLLRLFGVNQAPVLVMKNKNQDKLVLGLDLSNSEEPFLVQFDKQGRKHLQFGNY